MSQTATRNLIGYEQDLAAWAMEQARLLRDGHFSALDIENIAEEIESLSRSEHRELRSRLAVLLQHILRWTYQPNERSRSWSLTVGTQRESIGELLGESPSLRPTLPEVLTLAYKKGRREALQETGLYHLPESCPWTIEQILSPDFLPD